VVVVSVGGSKVLNLKLVLQRGPRSCKTWVLVRSVLPNEALLDTGVCELFEENGLTMTVDDLTLLSGNSVRETLPAIEIEVVYNM
jgi:hypothetical protein